MIPYRDENRTYTTPFINYILIAVNLVVFLFEILSDNAGAIFSRYAMIPAVFWNAPLANLYRIITSMFMHGGWLHFLGNMLFLWIFGDNIEDVLGHFRYLLFYLLAGTCGALVQALFFPGSPIPMIGASAAISGVIAAYLIFFPKVKVNLLLLFFIRIRLPAYLVIGVWIITQIFSGYKSYLIKTDMGGVAYFAHIGGILYGIGYTIVRGKKLKRKWSEKIKRKTKGANNGLH